MWGADGGRGAERVVPGLLLTDLAAEGGVGGGVIVGGRGEG